MFLPQVIRLHGERECTIVLKVCTNLAQCNEGVGRQEGDGKNSSRPELPRKILIDITLVKGTVLGKCYTFGALHGCHCQSHIYTVLKAALRKAGKSSLE